MRTIVTSVTVYTYDELSDDVKDKAVSHIRDLLNGEWWDDNDRQDITSTMMSALADKFGTPGREEYGIDDYPGVPGIRIDGWDLDQAETLLVVGQLTRENAPSLPWVDGIESVGLEARRDHVVYSVEDTEADCTCPDTSVISAHEDTCATRTSNPATDEQRRALQDATRDAVRAAWQCGYDEMEHKTSEDYARDWVENSEREYTEDGRLYSG